MNSNNEIWGKVGKRNAFLQKWMEKPAGLLLILWGWAQCLNYLRFSLVRFIPMSFLTCKTLEILTNGWLILVSLFTLYYLYVHRSWFKEALAKMLSIVWLGLLILMVFTNLIMHQVLGHVVFELQHALFMLFTALAITLTGGQIKNKWMFFGGILFAILALAASFFALKVQMLLEAAGWLVGFVIPGYLLLRRK